MENLPNGSEMPLLETVMVKRDRIIGIWQSVTVEVSASVHNLKP